LLILAQPVPPLYFSKDLPSTKKDRVSRAHKVIVQDKLAGAIHYLILSVLISTNRSEALTGHNTRVSEYRKLGVRTLSTRTSKNPPIVKNLASQLGDAARSKGKGLHFE